MNLTNTNSKKIIICIHGLQIKGHEHFGPFLEYAKDKLNYEAVTFNYFQHENNYSAKFKEVIVTIDKKIKHYLDLGCEVILFGYSVGGALIPYFQNKYPELKKVLLLFPAFKISWYRWSKGLWKMRKDRKALIKKMGKERYEQAMARLLTQTKDSIMSGNFFKLSVQNNWSRFKSKKYLSKVSDSEMSIFFGDKDWVTSRFNQGFVTKKISLNNNVVRFHRVNSDHTDFVFHSMLANYYDLLIEELNKF